jgi:hypothetical protein
LGTLLDYLPAQAILLLCDPDLLAERAEEYARQIPANDPFYIGWAELQQQAAATGRTLLEITGDDAALVMPTPDSAAEAGSEEPVSVRPPVPSGPAEPVSASGQTPGADASASALALPFQSIEAYRPLPAGAAGGRSAAARVLCAAPSLAAPGVCRACVLQQ